MKKIFITILALALFESCATSSISSTDKQQKQEQKKIKHDKDQDGVPDKLDECPENEGAAENNGCPWPDTDFDGVIDKDDACPTVVGPPENNGCPWPDTDGDGILDKDDACPTVPGLPEYNGCPKPKTLVASEIQSGPVTKSAPVQNPTPSQNVNPTPSSTSKVQGLTQNSVQVKKQIVNDGIVYDQTIAKKAAQNTIYDNEEYASLLENQFELTKNQPLSTFSIDVDNASYSNIRRTINSGNVVDKNSVRIEEMMNYFKYDYPQPTTRPFSITTEYNIAPWNSKHKLLKIGLQGKNILNEDLPPSNIIFLIDVSGSMSDFNKLPLLKSSFKVLLDQLRPQDKVGIVVYAGSAGMVLAPTSASEKEKISDALDRLEAGGSTAGGAGIELAYKLAQENFIKGGNNRVVLATDGDFNVGASNVSDLQTLIEEKRKSGIFLTCLGYGMGNYKDNTLETLADKGNGNYAYIDNLQEANKFLGKEFAGSMYTIAKDVKIQIEFNPKHIKSYRLIGYENRKLRNEDFKNDKIDAGELGSGHTVTALYEVIPVNVDSEFAPDENKLKYTNLSNSQNFGNELATVKFRYKKPDEEVSEEISHVIKKSRSSMLYASPDYKFVTAVAWFGLVLRESKFIKERDLKKIEALAKEGKYKDQEGYRSEFIRLVQSYMIIQK